MWSKTSGTSPLYANRINYKTGLMRNEKTITFTGNIGILRHLNSAQHVCTSGDNDVPFQKNPNLPFHLLVIPFYTLKSPDFTSFYWILLDSTWFHKYVLILVSTSPTLRVHLWLSLLLELLLERQDVLLLSSLFLPLCK